jgi:hypothetical protein|nr:MAG TPA: tail spike protein [Caudoviricetes sp.]
MSIQNYLNQIKAAVFGKYVRQSIHDAIKQCYDDASVYHDNANMEVKLARGTHETLNDRITENEKNQENLSSQLDTNTNKNVGYVNIENYKHLVNDDDWTLALQTAINDNKIVIIGAKEYNVKKIIIPNDRTLMGYGSTSVLNFIGEVDTFCIETNPTATSSSRIIIKDLKIANKDISINRGGIKFNNSLRGNLIENIWFDNIAYGINGVGNNWGKSTIKNINMLYNNSNTTSNTYGIKLEGNTIFCDNIEIVGNYDIGFLYSNGRVSSLTNFNIAGSSRTNQMNTAIKIDNLTHFKLSTGWVEQISGENGIQKSIILTNSRITLEEINVSLGSIYVDSGVIEATDIYLGNATSTFRCKNNAKILIGNINHINQPNGVTSYNECEADIFYKNFTSNGVSCEKINPTSVVATNAASSVIENEILDFIYKECKKVTTTTNYQGVDFIFTSLASSSNYTFMTWVKILSGNSIETQVKKGESNVDGFIRKKTNQIEKWVKIMLNIKTDSEGNATVRLINSNAGSGGIMLVSGYCVTNGFNPNLI